MVWKMTDTCKRAEELAMALAYEVYDGFVMGGWEPADAATQIEQALKEAYEEGYKDGYSRGDASGYAEGAGVP